MYIDFESFSRNSFLILKKTKEVNSILKEIVKDIEDFGSSFQEKNVLGIEGEFADVVVFDQKLVHISTRNCSNQTHCSIQIRINDISEQEFLDDGCPMESHTNLYLTRYKKMLEVLNNC